MISQPLLVKPLKATRDPSGDIRGANAIEPRCVTWRWF